MINEVVEIKFKKQNVKVEYHTFVKFSKKDIRFNSLEKNIDKYSQYLTYCKIQILINCYKKLKDKLRGYPYFISNFENYDFKHKIHTYKEYCGVSLCAEVEIVEKNKTETEIKKDEDLQQNNLKKYYKLGQKFEELKSKICEKCRKCIQKNYLDCSFRNFDNEYCGDLEDIIESYIKKNKEELAFEKLKELKDYVSRQFMIITINSTKIDIAEAKGCNDLIKDIKDFIDKQIATIKGIKNVTN